MELKFMYWEEEKAFIDVLLTTIDYYVLIISYANIDG